MAQTTPNIENKSADAAYVCKDNIVLMNDTVATGHLSAAALTQHKAKMDLEAAAAEARAALPYHGNVTGSVKRAKA